MSRANKLKPELSKKNRYWLSKHRYYELKHFCLQYPEWKTMYLSLSEPYHTTIDPSGVSGGSIEWVDSTAKMVLKREYYLSKMKIVEETARMADPTIAQYLFRGVTTDVGYVYLRNVMEMPCGKDMYYDRYRRFFWLLDAKLRRFSASYNEKE